MKASGINIEVNTVGYWRMRSLPLCISVDKSLDPTYRGAGCNRAGLGDIESLVEPQLIVSRYQFGLDLRTSVGRRMSS